jgi:hypothetical protein
MRSESWEARRSEVLGESQNLALPGVYILASPDIDRWKIGMSSNIERRVMGIAAEAPVRLRLVLAAITGGASSLTRRGLEGTLHSRLSGFRYNGEWFAIRGEDQPIASRLIGPYLTAHTLIAGPAYHLLGDDVWDVNVWADR